MSAEFPRFTALSRTAWSRRRTSTFWRTLSHETSTNLKKPRRRHDCCASVCHNCSQSRAWSTECSLPTNQASTAYGKVLAVRTVTGGVGGRRKLCHPAPVDAPSLTHQRSSL